MRGALPRVSRTTGEIRTRACLVVVSFHFSARGDAHGGARGGAGREGAGRGRRYRGDRVGGLFALGQIIQSCIKPLSRCPNLLDENIGFKASLLQPSVELRVF